MTIKLKVKSRFSAAHQLKGYKGDCENIHGHNFNVIAIVKVNKLDKIGIGIDFIEFKRDLDFFINQLDHKKLNDLEAFKGINPSSENIAIWLYENLKNKINSENAKLLSLEVEESENYSAIVCG